MNNRYVTKFALAAAIFVARISAAQNPTLSSQPELIGSGSTPATPQVKDDLLAGTEKFAAGAKDVAEVNMDRNTLGMIGGKGSALAGKVDFVVVRSYTYDKPGQYRQADFESFRNRLQDGSWSCMVHTRDKDGSTDICMRSSPDKEANELIIMTAEPKELTFVHTRGRMSLDDLSKLSSSMGAPTTPTPPATPLKKH